MSPGFDTDYGFVWGPVEVIRAMSLPIDRRVLTIETKYKKLNIYISATGRSVRVFSEGQEWKPSE